MYSLFGSSQAVADVADMRPGSSAGASSCRGLCARRRDVGRLGSQAEVSRIGWSLDTASLVSRLDRYPRPVRSTVMLSVIPREASLDQEVVLMARFDVLFARMGVQVKQGKQLAEPAVPGMPRNLARQILTVSPVRFDTSSCAICKVSDRKLWSWHRLPLPRNL